MKPLTMNNRNLLSLLLLGALVVLGLAALPAVRAADFNAGNAAELADAITQANAAGAGDHTIALTANITLAAPLPAFSNSAASSILLDGNGFTLDAAGNGTALVFQPGVTAEIADLTITGGDGNSGPNGNGGGAVFNRGDLTLTDVVLNDNTASRGAAIYNYGGEGNTAALTLTRVEITSNTAADTGGGILNDGDAGAAMLQIVDSTFSGNSAGTYGGALTNAGHSGTATVTVLNSTMSGNSSQNGGAIFNNGNNGNATMTLTRTTLSGNTVTSSGGAINNNGNLGLATLTLVNSTVSGNSAKTGGGILTTGNGGTAALTMHFTTLANNSAQTGSALYSSASSTTTAAAVILARGAQGNACAFNAGASIDSGGYNLDTDGSCALSGTGDISDGEAGLAALALNPPGDTATHALGAGSDALGVVPDGAAGCGAAVATDQRGAARPAPGGTACDIGAYESDGTGGGATPTATSTSPAPTPTVTGTPPSPTPTVTGTPPTPTATVEAPGECEPPYLPATEAELNAAIACVNASGPGFHVITLAADITLTAATTPLDNPAAAELLLDGDGRAIDGDYRGTVLTIAGGTTARVIDLTIRDGQGSRGPNGNWGGAIYNQGELTVVNSTLSGNLANRGGGIANHGEGAAAKVFLVGSTLTGNAALQTGGGVLNLGRAEGSATLDIENSTLAANVAAFGGGGVFNEADGGNAVAELRYTTVGLNTANSGGGGLHLVAPAGSSVVTLSATIVSNGSGAGTDCVVTSGSLISGGYNLDGDNTCHLTHSADMPGANAALLNLALNAPGSTATFALGNSSAAVNRIPSGAAGCGTTVTADQRGEPRPAPAAGQCDIGAYERQTTDPEPPAVQRVYMPFVSR